MKKSDELRQKRSEVLDQMTALHRSAGSDTFTDEMQAKWNDLNKRAEELNSAIEREALIEAEELRRANDAAKANSNSDVRRVVTKENEEERAAKGFRLIGQDGAINQLLTRGRLEGLAAEVHQEGTREARSAGLNATGNLTIPNAFVRGLGRKEKRDLTVGVTTDGGFTVATELGELIPFLNPRLVTEALGATFITGLSSNIDFPRNDAASTAVWEGENTTNDETTPTFDRIQLSPNRLGAFVDVSKQLIVQSSITVENFVRNSVSVAMANALDTAAINGSGLSNQPLGILNTSGIGSVALGTDGGNVTFKSIVDLETEISAANADFGNLAYLTTPGVRGFLKTAEKSTGTAQFVYMDATVPGEGMLNGYRARVSSLVPSTLTKGNGSNLHAVIFANWSELLIAQWGGVDLVVDPYTNAKNAQITLVVNSWWDIAVKHAASFAAIKDADITSGI